MPILRSWMRSGNRSRRKTPNAQRPTPNDGNSESAFDIRCSTLGVRRLLPGRLWPYSPSPMQILINFLLAIYVLVAFLMLLLILMQRPKSEGLGAAFGGGVTENIFGAQTTNVLVKFTAWLAGIFFALTLALSVLYSHKTSRDTGLRQELLRQQTAGQSSVSPAPVNPSAPAVPAASAVPNSSATTTPPMAPSASPPPSKPK